MTLSTFLLVPSQGPVVLRLFNTSSTSLKAVWGTVPDCCRHGIIRGYRLFLSDNNSGEFVRNETAAVGEYEFEFSALLKFYSYSFSILAYTVKGDGALSKDISAMTDEDGKTFLKFLHDSLSKTGVIQEKKNQFTRNISKCY